MFRKLIHSRGIKQKWLSQQIGVSEVTISNWMRGNHKPTEQNLRKISEAIDIDIQLLKDALNEEV